MNIFSIARIAILAIALVLMCVGTGVEQLKLTVSGTKYKMFLGGYKAGSADRASWKDIVCSDFSDRWAAAYAFAIISCIAIGFALIAAILAFVMNAKAQLLGTVSAVLSVVAFVTTLISWAIVAAIYNGKFCSAAQSYNKMGADMVGTPLVIVAWILMIIDVVVFAIGYLKGGNSAAAVEANA